MFRLEELSGTDLEASSLRAASSRDVLGCSVSCQGGEQLTVPPSSKWATMASAV